MDQLRKIGLRVFYTVLKQHRKSLPDDLRIFGDAYAKEEFRQANQKANQEQYIEFLKQWAIYIEQLEKQQVGKELSFEEKGFLNDEQINNLIKIKEMIVKQK